MAIDPYISDGTRFLKGVEYLTQEEFHCLFDLVSDPSKEIRQDRRGHSFIRQTCLTCKKAYAVAVGTAPREGNSCEDCTWQWAGLQRAPLRLDSHGNCFDHDALVEANPDSVVERIPGGTRMRPRESDSIFMTSAQCKRCRVQFWLSINDSHFSVVLCPKCSDERALIQQIGAFPPRDKQNDTWDALTYFKQMQQRIGRPKSELSGLNISHFIMDDLECARVGPRERLTVNEERTSIARLETSWHHPSECLETKPLPKMTRT